MTKHKHSILMVEDDADTRDALGTLLETLGYNVLPVLNGHDALAALRGGFKPCVILLDMAMPEMNGLEFRQEQLADPELAAIPVLVVSGGGYVNEADARRLGMATFFRKPMDLDAFAASVHRACGRLA